jgi:hypothetical protein
MMNFLDIIRRLSLIKNTLIKARRFRDWNRPPTLDKTYMAAEIGTRSVDWAQHSRFYQMTEADFGLRNVVFLILVRQRIMSKKLVILNKYHLFSMSWSALIRHV